MPRKYFTAGVGKSTEDAIGRLLLTTEGTGDDEEAVCIIADIDKCCEHVDHHQLVKAAIRHNFPLGILRLCLCMYRAARTISWNGVFAVAAGGGPPPAGENQSINTLDFVFASRTLVPGCSIALWLLQLVMLTPLDDFVESMPAQITDLEVYVDDASLQVVGPKGTVVSTASRAAKALFRAFQDGAGLPISETKGRVVASCGKTALQIEKNLKYKGYKAVRATAVLGVDTAAGKGGIHGQSRTRMCAAEKRKARFANLRKLGAKTGNVVRSALVPAVTYGSRVVGLPPTVLHRLRKLMRVGLPSKAKSASLTLQYMASRTLKDPTFAVFEAPLMFWAKLAFSGTAATRRKLQKAWKKQVVRVGKAKKPWAKVAGPAGAVTLNLKQLD